MPVFFFLSSVGVQKYWGSLGFSVKMTNSVKGNLYFFFSFRFSYQFRGLGKQGRERLQERFESRLARVRASRRDIQQSFGSTTIFIKRSHVLVI